jgi:hypothetical protein
MQSEMSAHIGDKGNYPCRKCEVGGTSLQKESDEGYHNHFMVRFLFVVWGDKVLKTVIYQPGIPRTKEKTLEEVRRQVMLACAGVAQPVKDAQSSTGIKDAHAQQWIERILKQYKDIRQENPSRTPADVEQELLEWTEKNMDIIYSSFLQLDGKPSKLIQTRLANLWFSRF